MKLTSGFAVLDVKKGRHALTRRFEKRPRLGVCPEDMRIPVTITGYIDGIHGRDDGVSREFAVTVEKVEVTK